MIATFSFQKDQWTRLSSGIHQAIQDICGPVDFSCKPQDGDQWPVEFTSHEDETCTCDAVEMLHYITELNVGGETVLVTWVESQEEEELTEEIT